MLLELLQHALRINPRVFVVEAGDKAERNDVVFAAVDPGAAVFFGGQRPSHGVNHLAGRDAAASGGHLPEFFYAYTIGLRVAVAIKIEPPGELLGQRSA